MFFDTNIIINILSQDPDIKLLEIVDKYVSLKKAFISDIVLVECLSWNMLDKEKAEIVKVKISKLFKIKRVTKTILYKAAELRRFRPSLKLPDAIIAATAIESNLELLTLDKNDFRDIDDLKLAFLR